MGNFKLPALVAALVALALALIGAGSASATMMCIVEPELEEGVLVCPEPGKFAYGVDFVPGSHIGGTLTGNATFESIEGPGGTVTCTESTFTAAFKTNGSSNAGEGITETLFNPKKAKECTSTIAGNTSVAVTAENLSYDGSAAEYEAAGKPQGRVTFVKPGSAVQIKLLLLKSMITCLYQPEGTLTANWNNGVKGVSQSQAVFTAQKFKKTAGGLACPSKERLNATYNLKAQIENKEIYIAKE